MRKKQLSVTCDTCGQLVEVMVPYNEYRADKLYASCVGARQQDVTVRIVISNASTGFQLDVCESCVEETLRNLVGIYSSKT